MPIPTRTAGEPGIFLRDQVRDRLRDAILDGTLLPGERVVVSHASRTFRASTVAVRAALSELEHAGLIEVEGSRVRVVSPSARSAVEHLHVLGVLRGDAVRVAVDAMSTTDLVAADRAARKVETALAGGDRLACVVASELWQVYVDATRNQALKKLHATTSLGFSYLSREIAQANAQRLVVLYRDLRRATARRDVQDALDATAAIHSAPR